MARYVMHSNGRVTNVVQASASWAAANAPDADIVDDSVFVGVGFTRVSEGVYTPPADNAPVPLRVTMRQARLALHGANKLSTVDAAIDALSEPARTAARIEWEYSNDVQRHNGLVAALGPALGLTDAEIDALFRVAAGL